MKKTLATHAVPLALAAVFICTTPLLACFVLDDAYISFRISENLALHGQMTWNLGEPPVESSTSFLWVVLNAPAFWLGVPPVATARVISVAAVLGSVFLIATKTLRLPNALEVFFLAGVALSPVVLLHSMQGMETAFAMFLLCLSTAGLVRFLDGGPRCAAVLWLVAAFLSLTTRPDSAVFQFSAYVATLAILLRRGDKERLATVGLISLPLAMVGFAYMVLRYQYFGYLLPNAFYIKSNSHPLDFEGSRYLVHFLEAFLAPYIGMLLVLLRVYWKTHRVLLPGFVAPPLIGIALFFTYIATVRPIQGFEFRFTIPVFCAFLYSIACLADRLAAERALPRIFALQSFRILLIFLAIIWPLKDWPDVLSEIKARSQIDRVIAGKALKGLEGRMLVSEAGALPFYSSWTATDNLGLIDSKVAHVGGLTSSHIEELSPDLIMVLLEVPRTQREYPAIRCYVAKHGLELVAAVTKTNHPIYVNAPAQVHAYLADPEKPVYRSIVSRLTALDGVDYVSEEQRLEIAKWFYSLSQAAAQPSCS